MKLHHIAIWTFRLEELKDFYVRFLGGTSNEKYINPKKGFESYFISFDEGPTLELMSRVDVQNTPIEENRIKKISSPCLYGGRTGLLIDKCK